MVGVPVVDGALWLLLMLLCPPPYSMLESTFGLLPAVRYRGSSVRRKAGSILMLCEIRGHIIDRDIEDSEGVQYSTTLSLAFLLLLILLLSLLLLARGDDPPSRVDVVRRHWIS